MAKPQRSVALGLIGLGWLVIVGLGGCKPTTPLESAGVSLTVPRLVAAGRPTALEGPGHAAGGMVRSRGLLAGHLPDAARPRGTAGSIAEGLANRLANLPELTVRVRRTETIRRPDRGPGRGCRTGLGSRPCTQRRRHSRGHRRQTAYPHASDHRRLSPIERGRCSCPGMLRSRPTSGSPRRSRPCSKASVSGQTPRYQRRTTEPNHDSRVMSRLPGAPPRREGACLCPRPSSPRATAPGGSTSPPSARGSAPCSGSSSSASPSWRPTASTSPA